MEDGEPRRDCDTAVFRRLKAFHQSK
jgi:hypothetical protein